MGDVYRAVDTRLNRPVAIKASAEQFGGRFDREAHAIAALNHPNICTLYDVGPDYLVMELVEGETLASRLRKGALPIELVVQYGVEIARALRSAHDKRIVHRDLKPGNVMITRSGVKVLDFGLAKELRDETQTATNAILGTPAYMAPEQLAGEETDTRIDIYAFGLLLYEMATGKRLGREEVPSEGTLPPPLAQTVRSCLANDPDKRWQSPADVEIALGWKMAPAPPSPQSRGWWPWAVAVVLALITTAVIFFPRARPLEHSPVQLQLNPPPGREFRPADIDNGCLRISLDGRRAAVAMARAGDRSNLWTIDLASGNYMRVTADGAGGGGLAWSPNGQQIAYMTGGAFTDMRSTVFVADAGGTAPRNRLTHTPHSQATPDWSPDGKFVLFQQTSSEANFDLWFVSMTGSGRAVPYLQTAYQEFHGRFPPTESGSRIPRTSQAGWRFG